MDFFEQLSMLFRIIFPCRCHELVRAIIKLIEKETDKPLYRQDIYDVLDAIKNRKNIPLKESIVQIFRNIVSREFEPFEDMWEDCIQDAWDFIID